MSSDPSKEAPSPTGLPDESNFADLTYHLLEFSKRTEAKAALLFIAFDQPTGTNSLEDDALALNAISKRLLSKARESDIYAHLEGFNFANLSIETSDQHASALIKKLKQELMDPIRLSDGSSIQLNVRIGLAQFPEQGENYETLMNNAKQSLT